MALRPGETRIEGLDPVVARGLLDAATEVGMDAHVVRVTDGGFVVPTEVAEAAQYDDTTPHDSDQE